MFLKNVVRVVILIVFILVPGPFFFVRSSRLKVLYYEWEESCTKARVADQPSGVVAKGGGGC